MKEKLIKKIEDLLKAMETMEPGSEEFKAAAESVSKLTEKVIEIERLKNEKRRDLLDLGLKNGISLLGIATSAVLTVWGTIASFNFEERGTITTIMGRGFVQKLLPKSLNK